MKAIKTCKTNNTMRISGPQIPDFWMAWLTASWSLNQCIIEASSARNAHRMSRTIKNKEKLKIFRVNMAISFGCPHYRIFELPIPEKELPKTASLKKSDPKDFGLQGLTFVIEQINLFSKLTYLFPSAVWRNHVKHSGEYG